MGIVGGVMLLTAVLLWRLHAVASACLQVLVGTVVVVIAVSGAQFDEERGAQTDASVSGYPAVAHH